MSEEKPKRKTMGPHGLGDPNDLSLRKVEKNVVIEKMMRDIARTEKCVDVTEALEQCGREQGWKAVFKCREENTKMKDCMGYWYYNKEFREEVTQMYLKERSEYRKTGVTKQQKETLKTAGYEVKLKT